MNFADLAAQEIQSLPLKQTVLLFPVGALEDHGPHLPVGLDLVEAKTLAHELVLKIEAGLPGWRALVMPEAPLSVDVNTSQLALGQRAHVIRDYLVDSCLALERAGFRHFVALSGNLGPRQLSAIEDAGRIFRRRTQGFGLLARLKKNAGPAPTLVCAQSALVSRQEAFRAPLWSEPREHGGQEDTSVALHAAPALVRPSWQTLPAREREHSGLKHFARLRSGKVSGYVGEPSRASAQHGRARIEETAQELLPKLRAIWTGSNPDLVFRSWYSIFPPNRSFFRAWLLALALVGLLAIWVYLNVQALTQ